MLLASAIGLGFACRLSGPFVVFGPFAAAAAAAFAIHPADLMPIVAIASPLCFVRYSTGRGGYKLDVERNEERGRSGSSLCPSVSVGISYGLGGTVADLGSQSPAYGVRSICMVFYSRCGFPWPKNEYKKESKLIIGILRVHSKSLCLSHAKVRNYHISPSIYSVLCMHIYM